MVNDRSHVLVLLNFDGANYNRWCCFFDSVLGKFGLYNHVHFPASIAQCTTKWQQIDNCIYINNTVYRLNQPSIDDDIDCSYSVDNQLWLTHICYDTSRCALVDPFTHARLQVMDLALFLDECDELSLNYSQHIMRVAVHWKLVRTLRGRALFLGRYGYSFKSVLIGDGHYAAKEDCIYILHDSDGSGMYNVKSCNMMEGPQVPDIDTRLWVPTWVFPNQSATNKP